MDTNRLFVGVVILPIPSAGTCVVSPVDKIQGIAPTFIGYLPRVTSAAGVHLNEAPTAGSTVLCLGDGKLTSCYILSVISAYGSASESYGHSLLYDMSNTQTLATHVSSGILSFMYNIDQDVRCARHAADGDSLPGDYDLMDSRGLAGLHIGRLLATLRGSPMAFVDCSNIEHKVRIVGNKVEIHTGAEEVATTGTIHVENSALSLAETFGILTSGTGLKLESERIQDDPANIPLYRMQALRGSSINGAETSVLLPKPGLKTNGAKDEPALVAKHRTSILGDRSDASALGLLLCKTPSIPGVVQYHYGNCEEDTKRQIGSETVPPELRTPFELSEASFVQEEVEDKEPERTVDVAALRLGSGRLAIDYTEDLQKEMAQASGVRIGSEKSTLKERFEGKNTNVGPTTEPAYPLPPALEVVDPRTGRKVKYYNSESFLSMEPDGSIVIADGYGSEIRMSRGNIYIGAALDVFVRPGRDYVNMTPGHLVESAQNTITLNSKKSVYMRANEDLRAVSAVGGTGTLVLENRATSGTYSGVVIRSDKDLSLTSNNIYIGRNAHSGAKEKGTTAPKSTGVIVIDAGANGALYQHAAQQYAVAKSWAVTSNNGGSASSFSVDSSVIAMLTSEVDITGLTRIQKLKGSAKSAVFEESGQPGEVTPKSGTCALLVEGLALINGSVGINENVSVAGSLAAAGCATKSGEVGKLSSGSLKNKLPTANSMTSTIGEFTVDLLNSVSETVFQDAYIMNNVFKFPEYDVSKDFNMPAMRWQGLVPNPEACEVWEEVPVQGLSTSDETCCYPGKNIWNSALLYYADTDKALLSGYIVNKVKSK